MGEIILNSWQGGNDISEKLLQGAAQLQLKLSSEQIRQIEGYLALLQKWNQVFNLTAITDLQQMLTHHVFDSLAAGRFITAKRYLDVGTGAGLPGIMLAILFPDKHFTLLDANSKKISFILQSAHQLHIKNITVVNQRIENYAPDSLFDGVISRAFSSLTDFVALCSRFIGEQGVLLAMKGPRAQEEARQLEWKYGIEEMNVPFLQEKRFMVIIS